MSDCKTPDNCRIRRSILSTTCMYFPPVYDGHGNNLNPDGNISSYTEHCLECGKMWRVMEQFGVADRQLVSDKTGANQ